MKKKILLAALLVAVLTVLAAGLASAEGSRRHGGRMRGSCKDGDMQGGACFMHGGRGRYGGGAFFDGPRRGRADVYRQSATEIPQEIRDKWAEAKKTAIDLRNELGKNPVDRDKALELHARHRSLMEEIHDWRFMRKLDALTAR